MISGFASQIARVRAEEADVGLFLKYLFFKTKISCCTNLCSVFYFTNERLFIVHRYILFIYLYIYIYIRFILFVAFTIARFSYIQSLYFYIVQRTKTSI